jgi:hypothetical protein
MMKAAHHVDARSPDDVEQRIDEPGRSEAFLEPARASSQPTLIRSYRGRNLSLPQSNSIFSTSRYLYALRSSKNVTRSSYQHSQALPKRGHETRTSGSWRAGVDRRW